MRKYADYLQDFKSRRLEIFQFYKMNGLTKTMVKYDISKARVYQIKKLMA